MPIVVTPEVGIPLPFDTTKEEIEDFRQKAHAYFETVQELIKQGASVEITDEDKQTAHQIAASGVLPSPKVITPGTIINLEAILSEYDQEVLDVHRRLRNYVTNKLIQESAHLDDKQRMRALENLGKIAGVGLFSDKIEIAVTNRSIDAIETELAKTLELYMGKAEEIDLEEEIKEAAPISIGDMDLDKLLGEDESGTSEES
jgi:hypothetical protein